MIFKTAYYFMFYTFWGFFESNPLKWGAVWKAGTLIQILECLLIFSVLNYYGIFFDKYYDIQIISPELIIPILITLVVNYFAFSRNDKWKEYASDFEHWPQAKRTKGFIMVSLFVAVVIMITISSFYFIERIG